MAVKIGITLRRPGHDGERLLAADRRAQRADRAGRPERARAGWGRADDGASPAWLRSNVRALPAGRRAATGGRQRHGARAARRRRGRSRTASGCGVFVPVYRLLPWRLRQAVHARDARQPPAAPGTPQPQHRAARPSDRPVHRTRSPSPTSKGEPHAQDRQHTRSQPRARSLVDDEEKVFEDIQAKPGEKAFVFIHTVPFEGSVALVNLLTSTRLVRKGFDVHHRPLRPGRAAGLRHPRLPGRRHRGASPGTWRSTTSSRPS